MRHLSPRFLLTVALLTLTVAAARWSEHRKEDTLAAPLEAVPLRLGRWAGVSQPPLEDSILRILRPSRYMARRYSRDETGVELFIGFYARQRAGESMHSPKNCLPGSGWEVWDYGTATVPLAGERVTINRYAIQRAGERLMVLYWYQSRERVFASEYLGKLLLVRDALGRGVASGAIVRLTLPATPRSLADGVEFAALLIPEVRRCLGG